MSQDEQTSQQQTQGSVSNWDMGGVTDSDVQNASNEQSNSDSNDEANKTYEIPITTKEEALAFAYGEMGKIMRNDGHKIELKVIGNINYRVGAWIRVFLPSFNEDGMFFITKASNEAGAENEWITSLTLVDYPPSLGKGQSNTGDSSDSESETDDESSSSSDSETDSGTSTDSDSGSSTGSDNGTSTGTGSGSSGSSGSGNARLDARNL